MRKIALILALCCVVWSVQAQDSLKTVQLDDVVITGTKSEVPVEKSGKKIFKLNQSDLANNAGKTVSDLLNEIPGVQTDGNFGPLGTNISYFIRGGSNKQSLILIDGVPFNDPSGIDQFYDLRLLDLSQVESIEVLKGGLSSLYGSGAAAGVINIFLKEPKAEPFNGQVGLEYASFNTIKPMLNVSGRSDKLSYSLNSSYTKSDGFSAAEDLNGTGSFDDDGFESLNLRGTIGYQFSENFSSDLIIGQDQFENDFDGGAFTDDDSFSEYDQLRLGVVPRYKWNSGTVTSRLFYSKLDRIFNSPDFVDPSARFIDEYDANNVQLDIVLDQNLSSNLKLIGGLNYQNLAYSQPALEEVSFNMIDPNATLVYEFGKMNIQGGVRVNNHSEYGSNFVYNFNPSYLTDVSSNVKLKLYGSYGTSFVAPSLYQLFGPFVSNVELKPEESESAEFGVDLMHQDGNLNVVYFSRKDMNRIVFDNVTFVYENIETEVEVSGVEVYGTYNLNEQISISGHYTYLGTANDFVLYQIPEHKYGFTINANPEDDLNIGLKHLHTGRRPQRFFNPTTFSVEQLLSSAFDVVDLFASYQFNSLTVKGSINNFLDESYVAIVGFNTIGRNYTLSLQYDF